MILADVSSGRSDDDRASATKEETPGLAAAETVSIAAEPPSAAEAKEAVRTVMTRLASVVCTVWMALPA